MSDTSESDNAPLLPSQKGTKIPAKFKFQIGDKTTIIDQTRRNLARKTIRRRNPEPRGTLKPLWSITPDGTIVDYTPHTITIDTHNRKNTVIRNNDIAISTKTRPLPQEQKQQEPKLRLINFVAWKTVGEYNRNKRKIEKFCLAEETQLAKTTRTGQSPKKTVKDTAQQEKLGNQATCKRKATTDEPGQSAKAPQQGMSTPIDEGDIPNKATNTSINLSPILTKSLSGPKKTEENITRNNPKGEENVNKEESDGISSQKNCKHQTD